MRHFWRKIWICCHKYFNKFQLVSKYFNLEFQLISTYLSIRFQRILSPHCLGLNTLKGLSKFQRISTHYFNVISTNFWAHLR